MTAEATTIVEHHFGPPLISAGFTHQRPGTWVRGAKAPIREVVQVERQRSEIYTPEWGVSLDFVPHRSGRTLAWHRNDRSARLDLFVSTHLFPSDAKGMYVVRPLVDPSDAIARSADATVATATRWFDRITDVGSLVPVAREIEAGPWLDTHTAKRLACAFVLAHEGWLDEADAHLETWIERHRRHLSDDALADLRGRYADVKAD
ncbi:MAG: hypothetical protein AAF548_08845 [Actinomycetota bacterium]